MQVHLFNFFDAESREFYSTCALPLSARNGEHCLLGILRFEDCPSGVFAIKAAPVEMRDVAGRENLLQGVFAVLRRVV